MLSVDDDPERVDVVVLDTFGRVLDVIPAHLGDRQARTDLPSLHEATLWGWLAADEAKRRLPPPPWVTLPCHDHDPPQIKDIARPEHRQTATATRR